MPRLLIVSNRLPINVSRCDNEDKWKFTPSSGGLVSVLTGLQQHMQFIWIGWPGIEVDDGERQEFKDILISKYHSYPVFINFQTSELHYNGCSNREIWPLFHYLPSDIDFKDDRWLGYKQANQVFTDGIMEIAHSDDLIWVHDYHLMLLPEMLRSEMEKKNLYPKIGFFLHIPFPSSEVFRVLPYRKDILSSLLKSDLIGFHTYDYTRHFLNSCTRVLGCSTTPASVEWKGRTVKVGAYPVGIEPNRFEEELKTEETSSKITELAKKYDSQQVIIGVERLDYIKGLTQKLLAFEEILDENPELVGKVVLIQVAVPSRTDVPDYRKLQNTIFELVGRINGKYSSLYYHPVQFIYNSVGFSDLVSLYRFGDVCCITSTRDGMNLVACEYVATQKDKNGVLILSEFAGAAQSLNGALLLNPWNLENIKSSILEALNYSQNERFENFRHLSAYVDRFTSSSWGRSFIEDLFDVKIPQSNIAILEKLDSSVLNSSLILFDEDLFQMDGQRNHSVGLCEFLNSLNNFKYYFTLNDRYQFQAPISINGVISAGQIVFPQESFDDGSNPSTETETKELWDDGIIKVIMHYKSLVPYSKLTISKSCISWNFDSRISYSSWIASELLMNLEKLIGHLPLKVLRFENEIIVIRSSFDLFVTGIRSLNFLLKKHSSTSILAICAPNSGLEKQVREYSCAEDIEVYLHYLKESL